MSARRELIEALLQGEVIGVIVTHVSDTYLLKEASVGSNDVVTPHPEHSALEDLGPRLQMMKTETLP